MEAAAAASSGQGASLGDSHFDDAIGELTGASELVGLPEYYDQSTSPVDVNATLAPTWSPSELNK